MPPNLNGASRSSSWLELDSGLASASSLVALGVGLYAGREFRQARVLGAVLLRALIWLGLTCLLVAVWGNSVSLLTLLIVVFLGGAYALLRVPALTNHIFSGMSGLSSAAVMEHFLS